MYKLLIFTFILSNVNIYATSFLDVGLASTPDIKRNTELMSCRKNKNQSMGYYTIFRDNDSSGLSPILEPVLSINPITSLEKNNKYGCVTRSYSGIAFKITPTISDNGFADYTTQQSIYKIELEKNKIHNKTILDKIDIFKKLEKYNVQLKDNIERHSEDIIKLTEEEKDSIKTIDALKIEISKLEDEVGYNSDHDLNNVSELEEKSSNKNSIILTLSGKIASMKEKIASKEHQITIKQSYDLVDSVLDRKLGGSDNDKLGDNDFNILSILNDWVRVNRNDIRTDKEDEKTNMDFDYMGNSFIEINEKKEN